MILLEIIKSKKLNINLYISYYSLIFVQFSNLHLNILFQEDTLKSATFFKNTNKIEIKRDFKSKTKVLK